MCVCSPGKRYDAAREEVHPCRPSFPHLLHRRGQPGWRSVRRRLVCSHRAIVNVDVTTLAYLYTWFTPRTVIKSSRFNCNHTLLVFIQLEWKRDPTPPRCRLIQLLQPPSPETMETVAMMMSLEDPQAERKGGGGRYLHYKDGVGGCWRWGGYSELQSEWIKDRWSK